MFISFECKISLADKEYQLFERGVVALERLADKFCDPPKPKPFSISVTNQVFKGDNTMGLKFAVGLPAIDATDPNANDIDHRTLTVTIDAGAPIVTAVTDLTTTTVADPGYVGNVGSVVVASLVDSDASGNNSPSRDETATLTDTIAPPTPGDFAIGVTGQV